MKSIGTVESVLNIQEMSKKRCFAVTGTKRGQGECPRYFQTPLETVQLATTL